MNKQDHIQYWIITAGKDWEVAIPIINSGFIRHAIKFLPIYGSSGAGAYEKCNVQSEKCKSEIANGLLPSKHQHPNQGNFHYLCFAYETVSRNTVERPDYPHS